LKQLILIIAFFISFSNISYAKYGCLECHAQVVNIPSEAVKVAKKYTYVREKKNDNRGPEIDSWHKRFGIPYGNPYCAMFALSSYMEVYESVLLSSPLPKYARVATFTKWATNNPLTVKTITPKQILLGIDKPKAGDIICWMHGNSKSAGSFDWNGHMGIEQSWNGKENLTVEGNTKPGPGGDQTGRTKGDLKYGLDGVYERKRGLGIGTNFPILYFVRLQKPNVNVK